MKSLPNTYCLYCCAYYRILNWLWKTLKVIKNTLSLWAESRNKGFLFVNVSCLNQLKQIPRFCDCCVLWLLYFALICNLVASNISLKFQKNRYGIWFYSTIDYVDCWLHIGSLLISRIVFWRHIFSFHYKIQFPLNVFSLCLWQHLTVTFLRYLLHRLCMHKVSRNLTIFKELQDTQNWMLSGLDVVYFAILVYW